MAKVLLIDDDANALRIFSLILSTAGFEVVTAETGRTGMEIALVASFDVVVIDLRLPDISGLAILQELRRAHVHAGFVIITGFGSVQSTVDAMRLGAIDVLEKPVTRNDLVRSVQRASSATRQPAEPSALRGDYEIAAASRWARLVLKMIESPTDLRKLEDWAHYVAVSHGTLKNWCRAANLAPRRSLLFARLLRAVVLRQCHGHALEHSLDVIDRRTLMKMLALGGLGNGHSGTEAPAGVDAFLSAQCLIRDPDALAAVKRALAVLRPTGLKNSA